MATTLTTAPDTSRISAASLLRGLVPEMLALALDAKQAHWNMTGPSFLPLHDLTEEIARRAGAWTDRIAERAVALGLAIDARPVTGAGVGEQFPSGHISDREAVTKLAAALERVAAVAREALDELDESDPVGHDIVVAVLEGLEKYRWMVRANGPLADV